MNLLPALALAALISEDACSARLDHLLVLYREYGLPLPAPDAPLLRSELVGTSHLSLGLWSAARPHRSVRVPLHSALKSTCLARRPEYWSSGLGQSTPRDLATSSEG